MAVNLPSLIQIEGTVDFFKSLGVNTKISDYTSEYKGAEDKIMQEQDNEDRLGARRDPRRR